MQISSAAEEYYAAQGIECEEAFIERRTQSMIAERLDPRVEVIDAYHAFVRKGHEQADRDANGLEEYFVSRAGGALDWNHPNRAGHRRIADFLIDADFCDLALPDSGPRDLRRLQSPR